MEKIKNFFAVNIGNTPQEQLAYIRKVHKWANIIGIVAGVFYFIGSIAGLVQAITSPGFSNELPVAIIGVIGSVPLAFCLVRVYAWGFCWAKGRFTKTVLVGMGAVAAATLASGEKYVEIDRNNMSGDITGTVKKKTNWLPVLIVAVLLIYVILAIGLYNAVKHTILEFRLKKQLESA